MSLTQPPPPHPAEFSPEVLDCIGEILDKRVYLNHVHDPFAGRGVRLAALCDRLGLGFTATDIERWPDSDKRVTCGDSTKRDTYPPSCVDYAIVTSPVYFGNRITTDYLNGPTPNTKPNGRRAYGISLGRPLDDANLARFARDEMVYYVRHDAVVRWWPDLVILNVDSPLRRGWGNLLARHGYRYHSRKVQTRRYRGVANSDKRASHEVVIVAERRR